MLISVINGSSRKESQSEKVSRYINKMIGKSSAYYSVKDFMPTLWNHEYFESTEPTQNSKDEIKLVELDKADGFVIVVPEWHGMVPPALKNIFLMCSREFAHKPALIVSVSAGEGGAYPVAELRMSGYKNSKICYLPEHVIVRHVNTVLNTEVSESEDDERIRTRLSHALKLLEVYADAFKVIRNTKEVDIYQFPYGM